MTGFFIATIIFGITVFTIFYLIKKHIFEKEPTFKKHIWIAVIVAVVCFLLSLIFFNGMDKIMV